MVHAVMDAADATNDLALAVDEAYFTERHTVARLDRLSREDAQATASRRRAAAGDLVGLHTAHTERVARLFGTQALRFACMTSQLLTGLQNGGDPADLTYDDVSMLKPSFLYRDPALLPPPPVADEDDVVLVEGLSLALTYADISASTRLARETSERWDALDPGAPEDDVTSVWGTGGVDLAQALHRYGHLCLWHLAGSNPAT
jgi:hypothetical protein